MVTKMNMRLKGQMCERGNLRIFVAPVASRNPLRKRPTFERSEISNPPSAPPVRGRVANSSPRRG
jgi:hypothetical protein